MKNTAGPVGADGAEKVASGEGLRSRVLQFPHRRFNRISVKSRSPHLASREACAEFMRRVRIGSITRSAWQ
jgi:hypothetical protein